MSYITIKLRRGTAAQWTAQNPVLAEGEFGAETDTRKFKIGNGVGAWNSLQYWGGSGGGASAFTDLTDVPQSYTGQGGKLVRVKADASGLEFYTLTIAAGDLPSGIDAAKIADGTISNTEFQYLNGVTSAIQTQLNGKQASLGFTPEDVANKSISVTTDQASNTKYPSVKSVYDWVTGLGYITSAALSGYATQAWVTAQGYITNVITALGYTPENQANKKTTLADNSDTFYPSQKAVKTAVDAKQDALGFTPENVANKSTSVTTDLASNTKYPSVKAVYDWAVATFTTTAAVASQITTALSGYATQAYVTSQGYITNVITALGYTPANKAGETFTGSISATNLSGTNTGDETQTTIKTKLGAASSTQDGYLTSANWSTFNGKQDALGFTPENSANKKTSLADNSDTFYPSQKAVKTAVDAKQDTLVSGTNIKTINGSSVIGSGDLTISGAADILEIQVFS